VVGTRTVTLIVLAFASHSAVVGFAGRDAIGHDRIAVSNHPRTVVIP